uniref:RNA helicase n=1 Tax=Moina macrocopa TaxID=150844 RepID=Q4W7T7_9CRUS|nr:VASA RNA helicase [Moina macrocopa]
MADDWDVGAPPSSTAGAPNDSWGVNNSWGEPKGGIKPPGGRGRGIAAHVTNQMGDMKISSNDSWGTSKLPQESTGPGNPDPDSSWVKPAPKSGEWGQASAQSNNDWGDAAPGQFADAQPKSGGWGSPPQKSGPAGFGTSPKKASTGGWGADKEEQPRGAGWGSSNQGGTGWGTSNQGASGGGWGAPNGGDRGSGPRQGGGSRGCFNCGDTNHMSRECPNPKKEGNSRGTCYNCGDSGHMSRECPNPKKESSSRGTCYNCQQEGHMSKDCPNPKVERSRGCRNCGEDGHMARECPSKNGDGNGGGDRGGNRACFNCGEEGHQSKDCEKPRTSKGGGGGACFRCQSTDHMAKDCPEPNVGPDGKPRESYVPPEIQDESELFKDGISTGNNFANFENAILQVTGNNVPNYITSFETAGLRDLVLQNIKASGYTKPTPVQKGAIAVVLARRDLIASAVTGSGKTAAFLVPVVNILLEKQVQGAPSGEVQKPEVVIISPTRELAIQIHREARKFSHNSVLKSVIVYGGTQVSHQKSSLMNGCNILVGTPGRLKDFVDKGFIDFSNVQFFILDEADRMLDMGFGSDIEFIAQHPTMTPVGRRVTLMFSATFPDDVQKIAGKYLHDYVFVTTGNIGGMNPDVCQEFHEVQRQDKRNKLVEILRDLGNSRVIVFVESKKTADFIAAFLANTQFQATSIHGDRLQSQREQALREFKSGQRNILVATNVAARGLDIAGVEYVINYDLPADIEEYVHRIGRTGRVGNAGRSISFYDPDRDAPNAGRLVQRLVASEADVPSFLQSSVSGVGGMGFNFNAPNGSASGFRSVDARRFGNSGASGFVDKPAETEERWE